MPMWLVIVEENKSHDVIGQRGWLIASEISASCCSSKSIFSLDRCNTATWASNSSRLTISNLLTVL